MRKINILMEMDNGDDMVIECKNSKEVVEKIIEINKNDYRHLGDLLDLIRIEGLGISEIVSIYAKVKYLVEGDKVIIKFNTRENITCDLWDGWN